jgi:hypothetical protein
LADGRKIALPGIAALPDSSDRSRFWALTEATRRGVEVSADGHVTGQIGLNLWCGRHAVRLHIVRVDLGDLLAYVPARGDEKADFRRLYPPKGWDPAEYWHFKEWASSRRKGDSASAPD